MSSRYLKRASVGWWPGGWAADARPLGCQHTAMSCQLSGHLRSDAERARRSVWIRRAQRPSVAQCPSVPHAAPPTCQLRQLASWPNPRNRRGGSPWGRSPACPLSRPSLDKARPTHAYSLMEPTTRMTSTVVVSCSVILLAHAASSSQA